MYYVRLLLITILFCPHIKSAPENQFQCNSPIALRAQAIRDKSYKKPWGDPLVSSAAIGTIVGITKSIQTDHKIGCIEKDSKKEQYAHQILDDVEQLVSIIHNGGEIQQRLDLQSKILEKYNTHINPRNHNIAKTHITSKL